YGEVAHASLDAPNDEGWPVSPGDRIIATLSGDPFLHVDMYLRWNAPATSANRHASSTNGYSDAPIHVVAPATATRVYISVLSYDSNAPWNLSVIKAEPKLQQLASYDVAAGDAVRTEVFVGDGNPDLYLRFGAEPTLTEYDCRRNSYY